MTGETYMQCELAKGDTHWIAWFTEADLRAQADSGWRAIKVYPLHRMVLGPDGRLTTA